MSFASAAALRTSETVTCAPLRRRKIAAARPDLPSPTTSTFLPFSSMQSSVEAAAAYWKWARHNSPYLPARQVIVARSTLCLSQLEGGECKECKHQGSDPEPDYDLRLGPAHEFEVMVEGRHFEDALFPQLVTADLQDDGAGFDDEDAADERQQQFLADDDGNAGNGAAEGERSDIAHKDFGGMGVVPEESDARADH